MAELFVSPGLKGLKVSNDSFTGELASAKSNQPNGYSPRKVNEPIGVNRPSLTVCSARRMGASVPDRIIAPKKLFGILISETPRCSPVIHQLLRLAGPSSLTCPVPTP